MGNVFNLLFLITVILIGSVSSQTNGNDFEDLFDDARRNSWRNQNQDLSSQQRARYDSQRSNDNFQTARYDIQSRDNPFQTQAPSIINSNDFFGNRDRSNRRNNYQRNGNNVNIYDNYNYRYAPPTYRVGANEEVYILTEERLRQIRSEFMYWYFDKGGDDDNGDYQIHIHNSNPQVHKNFNFQLPFFGFRFNYTRISMHGNLEFSDPPATYTYPLSFPNKNWPKENDHSFIGIFFSKCRIGRLKPTDWDRRQPGVYFRMERDLQSRTDPFGVEMKERLMLDIREGVVGAETFVPKHSVIITWKNMSFSGGIDNSLYTTNTFQLILATDEVYTYAIFNYAEMQWTSHTEAGGDTTGGEGGVPAFVGFNAGNGTQSYEYYPYSQRSTIRDLVGRGWANGFPGRHIFRIDENIMLGTCNKDIAGTNLPLVFAPESGNMLGGTIVNITGPCFEPGMKIRCKFDTEEVIGRVVDKNRAVCVQPFLMAQGYVIFDIAIGDEKYDWKGKYFVETPGTATERIYFDSNAIHQRNPAEKIKIVWDVKNLTSNLDAALRISLYGYRETTILPELVPIDILEENARNTGVYIIDPESYKERDNRDKLDLKFGFIQITLMEPGKFFRHGISPVLWSKPIPIGWYFSSQWEREYGLSWPEKLCDEWIRNDRFLKNFAAEVPQCPCILEHALADKGRYVPDYDCDSVANPNCFYHKGAVHCVRTGAPSLEGSEQQCCYDKNNYLMLSYDQQWGSRPRRSHNLGYLPWREANKVPTLSQWFHDMSPFYMCCLWQEEQAVGCETFRFERRPSQDCIAYQSPYVATVFGDPHFITFDDVEYTFNGKGEFVLVHSDTNKHKLDIQGRFQQVDRNVYGPSMATQLTSVAARDNTSAIIEVRMRPPHAQWRYRLNVFADGKRIYFDRSSLKLQHFPGVTVYTPSYILNQSEVIIMFESGAGVEVVEDRGSMTARVYLPWKFINQTRGLLGTWTFDGVDDFTLPDGMIIYPNLNTFEDVHRSFAMHWLLEDRYDKNKGGSLFYREYGRTASYYANRTFTPEWNKYPDTILPPNRTRDVLKANEICGDSYQCKYDYSVTLNDDFARNTLKFQDSYVNIKAKNKERVITCGILETPRFGRKSNFKFTPGTKVQFECNQDFVLIGDNKRICSADGKWDVPEYGYTECLRQQEFSSRALWVVIPIITLILGPLFLFLVCAGYRVLLKSKQMSDESSSRVRSVNPMVPPPQRPTPTEQPTEITELRANEV